MLTKVVTASASRCLSKLLQSQCKISCRSHSSWKPLVARSSSRYLSSTDGSDGSNNNGYNSNNKAEDPFGLSFDDGKDNVGPTLPPLLKRDAATGKLTGDIEAEVSEEEREILQMDPVKSDELLLSRLIAHWKQHGSEDGEEADSELLEDFARRVRLAKMSLNVLGRSVKAQDAKTILEDGQEFGRDGFTQPLTRSEFKTFQRYMKKKLKVEITEDDVPVHDDKDSSTTAPYRRSPPKPLDDDDIHMQGITDDAAVDPDNPDLSLKWLTSRANWEINKRIGAETPFDDMLPRDLNLSRIVNRKQAKILPTELLHHNNLALLRRYISPTGQIMHRIRTRLGARDQRRIARLIKRARCLGLIPHSGQFVVEDHGNIYEQNIEEMKPWEEELVRRGLVVSKKETSS